MVSNSTSKWGPNFHHNEHRMRLNRDEGKGIGETLPHGCVIPTRRIAQFFRMVWGRTIFSAVDGYKIFTKVLRYVGIIDGSASHEPGYAGPLTKCLTPVRKPYKNIRKNPLPTIVSN